jgi:hypothetical protein
LCFDFSSRRYTGGSLNATLVSQYQTIDDLDHDQNVTDYAENNFDYSSLSSDVEIPGLVREDFDPQFSLTSRSRSDHYQRDRVLNVLNSHV